LVAIQHVAINTQEKGFTTPHTFLMASWANSNTPFFKEWLFHHMNKKQKTIILDFS
jgi:hypothetical protein